MYRKSCYKFPFQTFVEDHDTQRRTDGRVLDYKDPVNYQLGVALLLSNNYGTPRLLSSYAFQDTQKGPPSNANYVVE